ncbi:hypothetical protein B0H65DRAFT_426348 [Neurospora tetraspora]|uniref:Uncharacterized protein n=1 Tax=Neurospora tetraspora TaxID=94610 RepID=A0AAE0JGZ1_9PEZI|nr:hypothetical protein B0H65DRAFT_426348 [Neurospora tetraspora]
MRSSNLTSSCISNRAALSQSGLTPTKTRTFGLSNASQLESAASGHSHVKIFDDGSLQHQRLAMFEAQHVLDDSNAYARFQDSTNTATANRDEAARIAFHQTRAAEAIHQFDNTFNLNK